jgi:hypothetical protein
MKQCLGESDIFLRNPLLLFTYNLSSGRTPGPQGSSTQIDEMKDQETVLAESHVSVKQVAFFFGVCSLSELFLA